MPTKYEEFIIRKKLQYGSEFDDSSLDPRFVKYFNSGERISVDFGSRGQFDEVKRGTIGVTTGWKPCFLLMLTKRSRSSIYTIGPLDCPVQVTKGSTGKIITQLT